LPRDAEVWYPGDTEPVVLGCDRRLGVVLDVENFNLRAPEACGGAVQCGYAEVSLLSATDSSVAAGPVAAAGTGLVLDLSALEPVDGDYLVHPELRSEQGAPYLRNFAEAPLDLAVTLVADGPCETGEGGASGGGNDDVGAAGVMGG
jgi:hypothetical protein